MWILRSRHCTSLNYLRIWRGFGTLESITIEAAPSFQTYVLFGNIICIIFTTFQTYLFLLDFAVHFQRQTFYVAFKLRNFVVKMHFICTGITTSIITPNDAQSPVLDNLLTDEFFLLFKAHSGEA